MNKKEVAGKDMYGKTLYVGDKVVFFKQEPKSYNHHGLVSFHLGVVTGHTECFILIKLPNGNVTNRSSGKILKYSWDNSALKETEEKKNG